MIQLSIIFRRLYNIENPSHLKIIYKIHLLSSSNLVIVKIRDTRIFMLTI